MYWYMSFPASTETMGMFGLGCRSRLGIELGVTGVEPTLLFVESQSVMLDTRLKLKLSAPSRKVLTDLSPSRSHYLSILLAQSVDPAQAVRYTTTQQPIGIPNPSS